MRGRALIPFFLIFLLAAAPATGPVTPEAPNLALPLSVTPLNELLPQDTLAFAELDPTANPARHAGQGTLVAMGLQALQSAGVLHNDAGTVADVLSLAGEAGSRRSCFALLDADLSAGPVVDAPAPQRGQPFRPTLAQPDQGRLNRLDCKSVQLVWIIETNQPADMIERLTRLVTRFSTQATARQAVKKTAEDKKEFVEFHDTRWPEWLTLAWAQEAGTPANGQARGSSPRFIVALGPGAMEHYLADRPVGEVPWKSLAGDVDKDASRPKAATSLGALLARVYVSPKLFRDRFPDVMALTILRRLFTSIDLATADACLFTARIRDRAVMLNTGTRDHGHLTIKPWTIDLPPDAPLLNAVPADATAYLALNMQWPDFYQRTIALLDAILTDPANPPVGKTISDLASGQGIDINADILANLQPWVLIHDSPQHPLGLPLMVTVVSAAEAGADIRVKNAISKLTASAAAALDQKAGTEPTVERVPGASPPVAANDPKALTQNFTRIRIRTDPDGISYLQFGLVGPAWGWVENRFIVSWSPGAVRANHAAASGVTSRAFAPPTTRP